MGRASNRKKEKRKERVAEARKLRIVVCAYPDKTLLPVVDLLKAATVYGDEVVLHHPTATMLASVAAVGKLGPAEFVDVMRAFAPALGEKGASFEQAMAKLEADHGRESLEPLLGALLDPTSALHHALPTVAGAEAESLADSAQEFGQLRHELDAVIEQQLDEAGVGQLMPAIDAGLLRLAPLDENEDFFDSYISALWSVLKDRRYYWARRRRHYTDTAHRIRSRRRSRCCRRRRGGQARTSATRPRDAQASVLPAAPDGATPRSKGPLRAQLRSAAMVRCSERWTEPSHSARCPRTRIPRMVDGRPRVAAVG